MSLINEMLRNLEKRTSDNEQCSAAPETSVVAVRKKSSRPFLIIAGLVLMAVLVWGGVTFVSQNVSVAQPVSSAVSPQPAAEPAVVKTETHPVAVEPQVTAVETVETIETVVAQKVPPVVADPETVDLLSLEVAEKKGGAALILNFSRLPEYRLLQKEGDTQLEMTFDQAQVGEKFEIPALPKNFRQISLIPQQQTLRLLVDLDKQSRLKSHQLFNGPEPGCQLLIEIETVATRVKKQDVHKPVVPKPQPTPVVETVEIPPAKVRKNRNKIAPDQRAYRAGLKQLQGGHWVAAEADFKRALSINPELLDARLKLIQLYQQQAEFERSEELLRDGLSLTPGDFALRKIFARQLLKDQRLSEAIELLEAQPRPGIAEDLEFHALLAALFQEAGRFDDARLLYSQLVQVRPQAALWWMGLAISLDQTDHSAAARDAYQRALVLPGLRPDLQDYIHNRLQVL